MGFQWAYRSVLPLTVSLVKSHVVPPVAAVYQPSNAWPVQLGFAGVVKRPRFIAAPMRVAALG